MLTKRAGSVLNILVNEYISTANPVASEEIARLSPTKVSPATVRNAMSRLTEEGYISRPHVSAGPFLPTGATATTWNRWRKYPNCPICSSSKFTGTLTRPTRIWPTGAGGAPVILSRITTNMAIVTVPQARSPRLKHIQLVYLEEFTALLIIVLQEARLLRRLLPLEEPTSQETLNQVANGLNDCFSGLNRADIETAQGVFTPLEERVRQNTLSCFGRRTPTPCRNITWTACAGC